MLLDARVRTAHADAWAVEAGLREGGAAVALRGIRVMAAGLAHPQWNSADVTAPDPDLEGARAFYAERGLTWGVRVPEGMPWSAGRPIIRLRLMGLSEDDFRPAPPVAGLTLRAAGPDDLETVLDIDCSAFESDREEMRPWTAPHLGAPPVTVALAVLDGSPVGTGYTLRSEGAAGPSLLLAGVAVLERARNRGVAGAMSSRLLAQGFAGGARLAHRQADTETAARVYARLGFADAGALHVYGDL
jgi:GNAT superfamily N-acetyltransferase